MARQYEDSLLQDVMSEAVWRAIHRERVLLTRRARRAIRREDRKTARRMKGFSAPAESAVK